MLTCTRPIPCVTVACWLPPSGGTVMAAIWAAAGAVTRSARTTASAAAGAADLAGSTRCDAAPRLEGLSDFLIMRPPVVAKGRRPPPASMAAVNELPDLLGVHT